MRILESRLASTSGDPEGAAEAGADLCAALCSLAELLVGGALARGELPAVEAEVRAALSRAGECSASSPEPGQVLASALYELGKADEALACLKDSMGRWLQGAPEEELEGWDLAGAPEPPSYEFRFECAKLLLELDSSTEDAIEVLETLVAEDDMDPNVWHMLALAYYSGGHFDECRESLERCEGLLRKLGVPETEEIWASAKDMSEALADAVDKCGGAGGAGAGGMDA